MGAPRYWLEASSMFTFISKWDQISTKLMKTFLTDFLPRNVSLNWFFWISKPVCYVFTSLRQIVSLIYSHLAKLLMLQSSFYIQSAGREKSMLLALNEWVLNLKSNRIFMVVCLIGRKTPSPYGVGVRVNSDQHFHALSTLKDHGTIKYYGFNLSTKSKIFALI